MAIVLLVTSFSGLTVNAYAASKPSKTSVTSVKFAHGDTAVKLKKISYKESDSTNDYFELQYSEDKKFKNGVNTIVSHCGDGNTIELDMPLATCETVYFRVRVRREIYEQKLQKVSWSKTKQKVWVLKSTTYSDWSSAYKAYVTWIVEGNPDDGVYHARKEAQRVIAQIGITDNMSDLEKVTRVQRWINVNWKYSDNDITITDGTGFYSILFAYSKGACNDFAWVFVILMKEINIPCSVIGGINHYWNIVKINGNWYSYDCEPYTNGDVNNERTHFIGEEQTLTHLKNSTSEECDYLSFWNSHTPHGTDVKEKIFEQREIFSNLNF